MRTGGGAAKGAEFERVVCKQLSHWLSRGVRDDLFWRTAMSGGRATMQIRRGKINRSQCGDVGAIDAQGERLTNRVFIDTKCHRDVNLWSMVYGIDLFSSAKMLSCIWPVVQKEAREAGRLPMLVLKQNRQSTFVFLNEAGLLLFRLDEHYCAEFPHSDAWMVSWEKFLALARRP